MNFNQAIAVIGLGKSGRAAAEFLLEAGAEVRVTDAASTPAVEKAARSLRRRGAVVETGGHTAALLEGVRLVVTSPGVPKGSLPLRFARRNGIPVISEIELAARRWKGAIVGITGSNGKTTTCHLVRDILAEAGRKPALCGNVGVPFLETIPKLKKDRTVVLELSSFQLEDSPSLRTTVACVLNVSANHLDRHGSLRAYARAKERIFAGQTRHQWAVINHDDLRVRRMARRCRGRVLAFSRKPLKEGIYPEGANLVIASGGKKTVYANIEGARLPGVHNLENILAAATIARSLGVPGGAVTRAVRSFEPLEHRIEHMGERGGVRFVNDSKSTTVESTRAAILAVPSPVILVAGGRDKGSDFRSIERLLLERVKFASLYGESRRKIASSWRRFKRRGECERFEDAVKDAWAKAEPGDTLLLSPMCTSFDQFASYGERGRAFKRLFRRIARS
ncbi:MAG: UDP-N-acetylmuramoylalanine--D-glutamate ligase [Omnitrophica WOR_2 bacterium RIFCSPHIGHO2_02_FULL_68_15]|nr:MAG: UDP-N-acetylmuramoylalanine--D-glutamate ligase [Omnitrophica WOR_2 bacterium RIFCSPHIGHO2_02_FULL_68_15]